MIRNGVGKRVEIPQAFMQENASASAFVRRSCAQSLPWFRNGMCVDGAAEFCGTHADTPVNRRAPTCALHNLISPHFHPLGPTCHPQSRPLPGILALEARCWRNSFLSQNRRTSTCPGWGGLAGAYHRLCPSIHRLSGCSSGRSGQGL